jgi:diguanylate cyclase (GGDEF)-like protein
VRAPFILTLRQLVFPTGLAVLLGLGALWFWPVAALRQHALWLVPCLLVAAAMAAVRLHTLRAFMALTALGAAVVCLELGGESAARVAVALAGCDLVLVLLADDSHFDWQAIQWWAGLLVLQSALFFLVLRWSPEAIRLVQTHALHPFGWEINTLSLLIAGCAAALLARFYFIPDPVSAGLVWAATGLGAGSGITGIGLAAAALAVAVLERTHWIAYHDELTGLPGRRAFNEALAALGDRYCIAVVDVDHFKRFNDTFGHDTGDQVLRKVASALADARGGTAYRCGGEEFAIVYPRAEMAEAAASANAVREEIEAASFMVRGPARSQRKRPERRTTTRPGKLSVPVEVSVTVSVGVAQGSLDADPDEVVKHADKALYAAKAAGRNRVELYQPARPRRRAAAHARAEL